MNFSCLSGICSVAGHVTRLREGPYRPPGKSIRPLITMVALLSACEVAVWLKKNCLFTEGASNKCGLDMKDVTFDLHPCARSKGRTAPAAPRGHTMKEHSTAFFCLFVFFGNIFTCPSETHPSWHVSCPDRHVGGGCFLFFCGGGGDREWIFTLGHCWETNTSTSWS